jgi:hypothetical protein
LETGFAWPVSAAAVVLKGGTFYFLSAGGCRREPVNRVRKRVRRADDPVVPPLRSHDIVRQLIRNALEIQQKLNQLFSALSLDRR